jgi:GNAT superfamily N-acetyltransferase
VPRGQQGPLWRGGEYGLWSPAAPGNAHRQATDDVMITRPLGKQDYDHIVQVIDKWWGGPTSALAHPLFFYELGSLARVVEHDGILVGFLFGFVAPGPPNTGYVHLVGIHPDYRRRGVGKVLYQTFEEDCRAAGCMRLKAITTLGNEGSIAFHKATGWSVTMVEDYAGPARPRVVFQKNLTES